MIRSSRSPAGYSGTPLWKKLGLKAGMRARFVDPPGGYVDELLRPAEHGVTIVNRLVDGIEFAQLFVVKEKALHDGLKRIIPKLAKDGMVWVSWPKKASGVPTEVDEAMVRTVGLGTGLVDVKICAVDETWSGLKFVWRKKDR